VVIVAANIAFIKAETAELFRQHRESTDESTRIFLENEIILLNINLALHKTKRFRHITIDEDDIVAAATAGLFLAVRSYDYTKSAFATYAGYVIDNEINELFRRASRQKRTALTPLSLDQELSPDKPSRGECLEDVTVNIEKDFMTKQLFVDLVAVCSSILSEIEFTVLINHLLPKGERKSQQELGNLFSCSQSHIARTEKKSFKKLREFIAQQEWGLELLRG
jgi:RNA polymerase sporulation-specific sigma factor